MNGKALRLAFLDGSLRPGAGNTSRALSLAASFLPPWVEVDHVLLAQYAGTVHQMAERLRAASGFLVGSGTYWNSWSSPLQRFLEVMTPYEATDVFAFKPASVVVTMDATGGAEVAARLSSTLVCFGCSAPPFGWLALSRIGETLTAKDPEATRDVWNAADLGVLAQNLEHAARAALTQRDGFVAWPVERSEPADGPWPYAGVLPAAAPDFLRETGG